MKTQMSRFQIHDDLTAPEASLPVVKGALAGAGQLPNFLGVLAGSPAALRAYARFRSELRNNGTLTLKTLGRIAPPVAALPRSQAGLPPHARTGRQAGLGLDELALAREWDSRNEREAALLRYVRPRAEPRVSPSPLPGPARRAANLPEPPPRGGARGRVERRAAARVDRGRRPGDVHGDGPRVRRRA